MILWVYHRVLFTALHHPPQVKTLKLCVQSKNKQSKQISEKKGQMLETNLVLKAMSKYQAPNHAEHYSI